MNKYIYLLYTHFGTQESRGAYTNIRYAKLEAEGIAYDWWFNGNFGATEIISIERLAINQPNSDKFNVIGNINGKSGSIEWEPKFKRVVG